MRGVLGYPDGVMDSTINFRTSTMQAHGPLFSGCIPALMTPVGRSGEPDYEALAAKGRELVDLGMRAVVYCGSMGDWPLLSDEQRKQGVETLATRVPVIVGTGAQSTSRAASFAAHARRCGAQGLMIIPRLLSRGISPDAQRAHFSRVLAAADGLPAVIYNSPYYGFETRRELFAELRRNYPNLVGFKEFGGAASLTYAAEHITSGNPDVTLMVGVDTQVVHGYVKCGATGTITGLGNALPLAALRQVELCAEAARGNEQSYRHALELERALAVLASFDEGPDLVLYYKHLMVLAGNPEYERHINAEDRLTPSQQAFAESAWRRFARWWEDWPARQRGK